MTLKEKDNIAKEVAHIFNSGANETRLQCLIERLLIKKEKQHRAELKEAIENVKSKVLESVYKVSLHKPDLHKLHLDVINIQYEEVKPKP